MEITLLIFAGLVCILGGAEFLIRGSVRLAERMGISRLLIGLTVVGFGTSTPELVTSVQGALIGSSGVAVGNIVGSNIFNILVILGLAAMIHPLGVPCTALKRDGLFVVATALLFLLIGYAWTLDRVMAVVLLTLLAGYIVFAWRQERARSAEGRPTTAVANKAQALTGLDGAMAPGVSVTTRTGFRPPVAMVIGGLLLLIVGGRFFVSGAIELARLLNVGEAIIGLTIVAAGTSLPELATSLVAALRRQADMAIGNVLVDKI